MNIIDDLRVKWLSRARALNLKEKTRRRDDACLNFLAGALAATPTGDDHNRISAFVFLVSVRGAAMFENDANKVDTAPIKIKLGKPVPDNRPAHRE